MKFWNWLARKHPELYLAIMFAALAGLGVIQTRIDEETA